mgnify:CR=1 FL=1
MSESQSPEGRQEPKPETRGSTCETCRFGDFNKSKRMAERINEREGLCRKYPPARSDGHRGQFPVVFKEDWCGEFEARLRVGVKP